MVQGTALWEGDEGGGAAGTQDRPLSAPSWGAQAPGSSELTCSGEMAWPLCSTGPRTGIKQVEDEAGGTLRKGPHADKMPPPPLQKMRLCFLKGRGHVTVSPQMLSDVTSFSTLSAKQESEREED